MVFVHPSGTTVVNVPALTVVPSDGLADVLVEAGLASGELAPLPHAGRAQPSSRQAANQRRTESREQTSSVVAAPTGPV